MDQTVVPLRAISLLWQHTDDVINLLLPLYITDDIFTVDGISNGPSTSHQGKDSITALVTHKSFLSPRVPPSNTHLNTRAHALSATLCTKTADTQRRPPIGLPLCTSNELCILPNEDIWGFRVEECVLSWSLW